MSGFANITGKVTTKVVVCALDVLFIIVTAIPNGSDAMFNKGIGRTLGDEILKKKRKP